MRCGLAQQQENQNRRPFLPQTTETQEQERKRGKEVQLAFLQLSQAWPLLSSPTPTFLLPNCTG